MLLLLAKKRKTEDAGAIQVISHLGLIGDNSIVDILYNKLCTNAQVLGFTGCANFDSMLLLLVKMRKTENAVAIQFISHLGLIGDNSVVDTLYNKPCINAQALGFAGCINFDDIR